MESPSPADLLAQLAALRGRAEAAERRQRELEALLLAQQAIGSSLELEPSLRAIVQHAAVIGDEAAVWLFVLEPERRLLRCRAATRFTPEEMAALALPIGQGLSGQVALTRQPLTVSDLRADPRAAAYPDLVAKHGLVSYLGIPIIFADQLLGVLAIGSFASRTYSPDEIALFASFATQAAAAITNARLYGDMQRELEERGRAEAALLESEERYRRITKAVTDYIYTVRVEGGRPAETSHGPGCVAVTGYSSEEFARDGDLWIRMVDEADRGAVVEQASRLLAGEDVPAIEHRIVRKDGAMRWVRNTPVPHRDAQGALLSYDGLIQDVTERRQAEAALLVRTRQLEAVRVIGQEIARELDLRTLLDLIVRRAVELVEASRGMIRLWDEASQLLVPKGWVGGGETAGSFAMRLGEGVAGTAAERREGLIVNQFRTSPYATPRLLAGSVHNAVLAQPLLYRERLLGVLAVDRNDPARPFTNQDGETLALLAAQAAVAIENAQLLGAAVRRGEELEALLRAARALMSEVDLQRILDQIVTEAAGITGCAHVKLLLVDQAAGLLRLGALKGTVLPDGFQMPLGSGLSGRVAATGERLFVDDPAGVPENVLAEHDRSHGIVSYLGLPIKIRDRVLGVLTFNTTDRRRYSEEELIYLESFADHAAIALEKAQLFQELNQSYTYLQWTQDELIRVEKLRALGQMSAGIAHDLNNMLASILGQVELLRLRAQDAEVQESLRMLETAATDGAQVVRRVQDFARQREQSPLAPVDLARIVTEALEITRPRWRDEAQRQGRVITIQLELAGIPPILGYAPEVREVLTNLILNAVDAMPHGGTLSFEAKSTAAGLPSAAEADRQEACPESGSPGWVELSVADTGVGMSEEVRKRIFDPFFTTKGGRGIGLGLSVVYGIMERHGGHITARSAPGQGTTVTLRFQGATGVPRQEAREPRQPSVSPRRLLVVDDDPMVRRTIAALLAAVGHRVVEADGGAAGIARIREGGLDLVLTDLGMPEVTGWDVARAVKDLAPETPVILLTGWGEQGAGEPPVAGLVNRVMAKPVRLDDVLAAIEELTRPAA